MWADVRNAYRTLRASPGFAAVAVVSLGLGIGANVGIFTLLNALVLRDLPVQNAEQLVNVSLVRPDGSTRALSFPMFQELQRQSRVFSSIAGWWGDRVSNVETRIGPTHAGLWAASGQYYRQWGVTPAIGRFFDATDLGPSERTPSFVAVIGYQFWERQFGSSPAAIGERIRVEGIPFTVIGVAPRGFTGVTVTVDPDVTIPLTTVPLIASRTIDEQLLVVAAVVAFAGGLAGWLPARRACRTSPLELLKAES